MKIKNIILILTATIVVACAPEEKLEFGLDTDRIEIDCYGGVRTFLVTSSESWVAVSSDPWLTVSPANGNGPAECKVSIDTTLLFKDRQGGVRIQSLSDKQKLSDIAVVQKGYSYQISVDKAEVSIDDFAAYDDRSFDITVASNVDFDVEIPADVKWLKFKKPELVLDRGARPRTVRIHFDWTVNADKERKAVVNFRPKAEVEVNSDVLTVVQKAAPEIIPGTVAGDSLALLAINRALGCWNDFETEERMADWSGVTVWKSGPDKGRVRSVQFIFFNTQEPLPYAVRFLTAAEELEFYSNENSFNKSLDMGDDICELVNLKKLTVGAYGLTSLPEKFSNLQNLRYLDLSSNNFQKVPEVLKDCKSLTALFLTANQRSSIPDLSNTVKINYGGLVDECPLNPVTQKREFPRWLLKWNQLDTLRLSVNYLQGELPSDAVLIREEGFETWTTAELRDSLGTDTSIFDEYDVPKVLPDIDFFSINLNRLHGDIPYWLKYHPKLDLWFPLLLVFPQEGKTAEGIPAGFNDTPTNLNYYYEVYKEKMMSDSYVVEE